MNVHPRLVETFEALEGAGVAWCLLRGEDELARPPDVDLLIRDEDQDRAASALAALDFVRLPAVGYGLHRFFVSYDEETGIWLRLDVVGELGFGSHGALASAAGAGLLGRAVNSGSLRVLAPDDAFWTLVVRSLLDRGEIGPRYTARVQELAGAASEGNPLARELEAALPAGWTAARVRRRAEEGAWDELAALAPAIGRRWARRHLPTFIRRRAAAVALRVARPVVTAIGARGISVALLGPDGSGKSTIVDAVAQAFTIVRVHRLYLGLYSDVRTPGRAGRLGRAVRAGWIVRARAAIGWHVLRGRVVLCDRHTVDALLGEEPAAALPRWRRQLVARSAPRPDLLVLLDAPAEILAARKPEHTAAELEEQRRRYHSLARRVSGTVVVDTSGDLQATVRGIVRRAWNTYTEDLRSGSRMRPRQ